MMEQESRGRGSVIDLGDFVVADLTARLAVVEAIVVETHVELALAEAAILLAFTTLFGLLTLTADDTSFGCHGSTLARSAARGNVPLVTEGRL